MDQRISHADEVPEAQCAERMSTLPGTIILSRPDALGDAVVTLPMAGLIKQVSPDTRVIIVCSRYAQAVWRQCSHADEVITLEDLERGDGAGILREAKADAIVHVFPHRRVAALAKEAGVRLRIGTSHRLWHWWTCNRLVRFSRKRSNSHEALLNMKLLESFGVKAPGSTAELIPLIGLKAPDPSEKVKALLRADRKHLVVHPLLGSGVGWGLSNFAALVQAVDPLRWQVIVTGTSAEAERYRTALPMDSPHVTDAGGQLDLVELMMLLGASDAMVAGSTGPLHIGAALGLRAIGLFSMRRPIFPARWHPLGIDAHALVHDPACADCAQGRPCACITRIPVSRVLGLLEE